MTRDRISALVARILSEGSLIEPAHDAKFICTNCGSPEISVADVEGGKALICTKCGSSAQLVEVREDGV